MGSVDWTDKDLSSATLVKAKLVATKLVGANMSGRDLTAVDLAYADLSNANFAGAYTAKISQGCQAEGYYRNSQVVITRPVRNLPSVVWKDGEVRQWGMEGDYFLMYCAAS